MSTREKGYAICVENRGAEDLEVRTVYRVLPDKAATATGSMRVIDGSGEDYLYPDDYFVSVELPSKAKRAWAAARSPAKRRGSPSKPLGLALRISGGGGSRVRWMRLFGRWSTLTEREG